MADGFHEKKFREGVVAWNAWRKNCAYVIPRLEDVDLSLLERQLSPENEAPIDLIGACLDRANLRHATFIAANFQFATLVLADLSDARLEAADFSSADLTGAVLDGADLAGAKLAGTILAGARLGRVRNLTQEQVDQALGDTGTVLPPALEVPEAWKHVTAKEGDDEGNENTIRAFLRKPKDLYSALGLSPQATKDEIRAAYYMRAMFLHPDRNQDNQGASEFFAAISNAAHILRDPPKRKLYDRGDIGIDGKLTEPGRRRERLAGLRRAVAYYFFAPLAVGLSAVAFFVWVKSPVTARMEATHIGFNIADARDRPYAGKRNEFTLARREEGHPEAVLVATIAPETLPSDSSPAPIDEVKPQPASDLLTAPFDLPVQPVREAVGNELPAEERTPADDIAFATTEKGGEEEAAARRKLVATKAVRGFRARELVAWSKAKRENDRKSHAAYLEAYPNGRHAKEARARVAKLNIKPRTIEAASTPETTGSRDSGAEDFRTLRKNALRHALGSGR